MSNMNDRLAAAAIRDLFIAESVPAKPDARFLIQVLRNPLLRSFLAPGFRWDYPLCETCAMGLAATLWPEAFAEFKEHDATSDLMVSRIAAHMNLDRDKAERALIYAEDQDSDEFENVSAFQVADLLEEAL